MKIIRVEKNKSGIRIDKFLSKEFFSLSRGEIIKNIKEKEILVNDALVKPSYKLKEGDMIKSTVSFKKQDIIPNKNIKLDILYSDENIIAIDKPPGIQVHPDHNEKENTLVNALISKFPEIENVHDESLGAFLRPGVVQRLDKDTSGVMIFARNLKSFFELKKLFQERKIHKKYITLAEGQLKDKKGLITKPIARAGSYKKQVIAGAKTKTKIRGAVTEYKLLRRFDKYSLVEVTPLTGRMHQIRIHFFSIGHPVVGDKLYKIRTQKTADSAARQLLHAAEIEFSLFGKKFIFKAPLPQDFNIFLKNIERS